MKRQTPSLKTRVRKTLGLTFRNFQWLESALTHPSFRNENLPAPHLFDFDRLEFFGDAILNYVICRKLYAAFPEANEGMLSRLRSILVSRKILARIARELKFYSLIHLGKSIESQPVAAKSKILADGFEALLAALYFDQGLAATEKFILRHFRLYFNAKRLFQLDPNPKSTLQELSQKKWQKLPSYVNEMIPSGFKSTVSLDKTRKASAVARTRQESEEKAARLLIRKIRQELLARGLKRTSSGKKLVKAF